MIYIYIYIIIIIIIFNFVLGGRHQRLLEVAHSTSGCVLTCPHSNGVADQRHPLFKFLKKSLPGTFGNFVKWNFTKFLITRDGLPYKRYGPKMSPLSFESDIEDVLAQQCQTCDPDDAPPQPAAKVEDWEGQCLLLLDKLELQAERRAAAEEERDTALAQLAAVTAELEATKTRRVEAGKVTAL